MLESKVVTAIAKANQGPGGAEGRLGWTLLALALALSVVFAEH
jgi:hypothetical protein